MIAPSDLRRDRLVALRQRRQASLSHLRRAEERTGYLFVLPLLIGFLLFVAGPLIAVLLFGLQERSLLSPIATFVGLENYRSIVLDDMLFRRVLANSLVFSIGLVGLNVALALALALLLNASFAGNIMFRTIFFAPVVTSSAAWALVWLFLLQGQRGTVNQYLALIGISGPNWLRDPQWAMLAVIATRVLKNVGLNMIILLAALKQVPSEYLDAAQIDGAAYGQRLRSIILPLLAPTLLMVTVITLISSLQVFDHIMLLTQGGPANATMVLVFYIYHHAFKTYQIGYASALAVILFAITLGLTALQWSLRRRVSYEEQ